jgi:hypothetical protein
MKTKLVLITSVALFLTGCLNPQPYTKIGVIGYENKIFEKTVDMAGEVYDTDEDGKWDRWVITKLMVTNDATRVMEINLRDRESQQQFALQILDHVMQVAAPIIENYLRPQPVDSSAKESQVTLADLVNAINALRAENAWNVQLLDEMKNTPATQPTE